VVRVEPGGTEVRSSRSPVVIEGLQEGRRYTVQVAAVNEAGVGEWGMLPQLITLGGWWAHPTNVP
jgi:hypothetical protein